MALEPDDIISVAERLIAQGGEAASRSAINRVYYACHLAGRDQLFGLDASRLRRRPTHLAVIDAVATAAGRDAEDSLVRLKRMREIADYVRDSEHPEARSLFADARVSDWPELADQAMLVARDLLPLLQVLPAERTQDA